MDDPDKQYRVEPIVYLLFAAVVFFTLLLVAISKWSPNDGQTFQVVSGLVTGFAGALLMRVKPPDLRPQLPPGTTQVTDKTTVTKVADDTKTT